MESFLTSVMTSHGYLALIILAFIEACCIPISSEITFALAGWLASPAAPVHDHRLTLVLVIGIGTLAEMGGSLTSYAVGRRGGRTLLDRYGKWVLVSRSDLDRAERLFAGRGSWVVAVARVLPLVRCFASFGAGAVEIPAAPFAIFSVIGTAAWATALSLLGYNLGDTVTKFFHSFSVIGIVLVVVLVLGLIAHRVHAVRKDSHRPATADGKDGAGSANAKPKVGTGRSAGAHRSTGRGPTP
jgi:membrane protein DedA with SNARE-associated domain